MRNLAPILMLMLALPLQPLSGQEKSYQLPAPGPDGKISVFNGKDLTGWEGTKEIWSVKDGVIVAKHNGLANNDFLKSQFEAGDFRLTLQIKLIEDKGNTGIQFRSQRHGKHEMKGYQADGGPGWWGKLYEESGRALLWNKSGEQFIKKGDWNTYEIVAVGHHIQTAINGNKCVDLQDPKGDLKGIFGLQIHSDRNPTEVHFKDLRLQLNPKAELETLKK
jgi:hypothetical protein